jgi:hypothetical protein
MIANSRHLHVPSFFKSFSQHFELRTVDFFFHTFMQFGKCLTEKISIFLILLFARLRFISEISDNLANQIICITADV